MEDTQYIHYNLTAAEAVEIMETYERRRAGQCPSIMDYTLARIHQEARAGNRSYFQEGIGDGVNLEAYVAELERLGYKVRLATKQESNLARSIVIEW